MVAGNSRSAAPAPWLLVAQGVHYRGGMERANAALAVYLASERPVHLVAHSVAAEIAAQPRITVTLAPRPGSSAFLGRFYLDRLGRRAARQLTRNSHLARVVVNGVNCRWSDINWVHWVHQCWRRCPVDVPRWFRLKHRLDTSLAARDERSAFAHSRLIIANSERTRRDLINLLRVEPERINTIYPGTDAHWKNLTPLRRIAARTWLEVASDQPLVVFVGGLGYDSRKGFDILWRAWRALCAARQWDAALVVAGGGRAISRWRREVARAGLSRRVRFLGHSDRIVDVLAGADLLVSPARYESYGLNVQEALCLGVPAIVSADAGVAERYSPELAPLLLPNADDSDDLAARMLGWRADMARWHQRVQPLARKLRGYTWEDMARLIVAAADGVNAAAPRPLEPIAIT